MDEERTPVIMGLMTLPANHRFNQSAVNQEIPVEHLDNGVQLIPTDDIPEEYVHHCTLAHRTHQVICRDLVNRLIRDNQDLWNQLLQNDFVEAMRIASADNQPVLDGFKWYMIVRCNACRDFMLFITLHAQQDFFYCVQLIAYNANRAAKAPSPTVYADLTKTLKDTLSHWAPHALKVCTDANKLNIPDTVVFAAKREQATERYTKFIADVAEDESYVVSLLAQVPGIQVCG